MGSKYKHITEEFGADWSTDYEVVKRCIPDCPACAFKAGYQQALKDHNLDTTTSDVV